MIVLFPLTNLIFIVFAVAIACVAIYFNQHTYYTSAMPVWANYVLFLIAIFVLIMAGVGYYSGTRNRSNFLSLYIIVLSLSSFLCLIIGVAMILKTSTIKDAVSREWYEI